MDRRNRLGARTVLAWAVLTTMLASAPLQAAKKREEQPDRVRVQHILISFKGKIRGKEISRKKKAAQALADKLLKQARDGEDFAALVEQYTDDSAPGIYLLGNTDQPKPPKGFKRSEMALYFGDVAFDLEVGEIGMAKYHPFNSPYGWHIIKRLE